MSGRRIYRGQFDNTQVDYTDNSANEQRFIVSIFDQIQFGINNPYDIQYSVADAGGGNSDYTFTFDPLPGDAVSVRIDYSNDGGVTYGSQGGFGTTSPQTIQLPTDDYIFIFFIQYPPPKDDDFYVIEEEDEIIEIDLADRPSVVSVIDNDEDKFTPIRSKQAEIRLHTSNTIDITTFASGSDTQFYVEIAVNDTANVIFKGWLSVSDLQQEFQPHPNVLVLTATDGLGFLKDIPLVDYNGDEFSDENKIIEYIAGALRQTGLDLSIVAEMNIREADYQPFTDDVFFEASPNRIYFTPGPLFYVGQKVRITGSVSNDGIYTINTVSNNLGILYVDETIVTESTVNCTVEYYDAHFYNSIFLDAKTFEGDEVGEFEDCYTVLEKILTENATLYQQNGKWYIKRPDEIDSQNNIRCQFDSDGTFNSYLTETSIYKEIGRDESKYTMAFMNADAVIIPQRAHYSVRHDYNYETPKEVPCNINFSRGDYQSDASATEKIYALDCWTLREGVPGYYGTVDGTTATIHRIFDDNDYETERYIVLTPRTSFESSSINDATYIESQPIYIQEKDKFTASVDWRLNLGVASGSGQFRIFRCVLLGDDGSWWILGEDTVGDGNHKWFNTTGWTVNTAKGETGVDFTNGDEEEFTSVSWSAPPAPVTGKLYLWLNQFNQDNSSNDDKEIWFNNLQFEYLAYINGSYSQFSTGQYHISEQTTGSAKREKEVFISDSPKRLFKGALLKYNGSKFVLTEGFYNAAVFPTGVPSSDYIHPFGEIQNQDVWNQYNRLFWAVEGTIDGLDTDTTFESLPNLPDLHHFYYLRDSSNVTNNKKFMLLHYEQDHDGCEWSCYFVEAYDSTQTKRYTGHTFKYIESDRQ